MFDYDLLVPLAGIFVGGLMILIPVAGLTARFALKPLMDSFAKNRAIEGQGEALALVERRLALLEEQVHGVDRSVRELVEEAEFRRKLESGPREG
jgi:hypothetical protein